MRVPRGWSYLHVRTELAQGLVEVVHLGQDTPHHQNDEDVGRGVRELVISCKSHLEGNAKRLDEHDGDGAGCRANRKVDERIFATILGCDLVDHKDGEDGDKCAVE